MSTFLIAAAFMAALAAAVVAVPLLRARQSRLVAAVAAVLIAGSAAGLYPLWSNWNWGSTRAAAAPDVLAMVTKLEAHLRDEPNDGAGWLMLGRSYLVLERVDDALLAYDHAHRLDPNDADAALGLGEAMSLQAGGNITAPAAELFEQALKLAPANPKALLYGGFAAAARGDADTARARWQALKDLHPPEQIEKMLDARMAELGASGVPEGPGASDGAGAPAAGSPSGPADAGSTAPAAAASSGPAAGSAAVASATVNIRIAPQLKARLTQEAPLFLFAREPGGQGPPMAAKRLTSGAIGTQIRLTAADSMIPGRVLVNGQRVAITARVSFSGQPLPAAGDLYGEISYEVGRDGIRDLVIDRVAE